MSDGATTGGSASSSGPAASAPSVSSGVAPNAGSPANTSAGSAGPVVANVRPAEGASTQAPVAGSSDTAASPAPEVKKYKIRAGQKEFEVTEQEGWKTLVDGIGEDAVLDLVKLRKGSYDRFEHASKLERQLREAAGTFQNLDQLYNAVYQIHGEEAADQWIENVYKQRQALRQMTPEQRQQYLEDQKYQQERAQFEAEKRKLQETRQTERRQQAAVRVREMFTTAATEVGIPVTDAVISRMAIHAKAVLAKGAPISYKEIARNVQAEIRGELNAIVEKMAPDQLREFLGEERIKTIRGMEAERLTRPGPVISQPRGADGKFVPLRGNPAVTAEPPKRVPLSGGFRALRERKG